MLQLFSHGCPGLFTFSAWRCQWIISHSHWSSACADLMSHQLLIQAACPGLISLFTRSRSVYVPRLPPTSPLHVHTQLCKPVKHTECIFFNTFNAAIISQCALVVLVPPLSGFEFTRAAWCLLNLQSAWTCGPDRMAGRFTSPGANCWFWTRARRKSDSQVFGFLVLQMAVELGSSSQDELSNTAFGSHCWHVSFLLLAWRRLVVIWFDFTMEVSQLGWLKTRKALNVV